MMLQGFRVLVIEDEITQALATAQVVTELGAATVLVAPTIPSALQMLATQSFDCVTLDLNMNGHLALGLALALKRRRIPFLFCTAYANALIGFEGIPVVEKPISASALRQALAAITNTEKDTST